MYVELMLRHPLQNMAQATAFHLLYLPPTIPSDQVPVQTPAIHCHVDSHPPPIVSAEILQQVFTYLSLDVLRLIRPPLCRLLPLNIRCATFTASMLQTLPTCGPQEPHFGCPHEVLKPSCMPCHVRRQYRRQLGPSGC